MSYLEILKRCRADAGIGKREQVEPEPETQASVVELPPRKLAATVEKPALPDSILMARNPLKEICRLTLESNPEAHRLSPDGRRWIGEHLEAAVLNWLSYVLKPEPAWDAVCPKGHRITDGIFARVLMGWCCAGCQQVYPTRECELRLHE